MTKFGPTEWVCSICEHSNAMAVQRCERCQADPRQTLSDGSQIYPEHRAIRPETGQQQGYVVLAEEERAKGFVRPYRDSYVHRACGTKTTMGRTIAETYARDPKFYGGTFCCGCRAHFPLSEFLWDGTDLEVGS